MFVSAWTTKSHLYDVVCVCVWVDKTVGWKNEQLSAESFKHQSSLHRSPTYTPMNSNQCVPPSIPKYPRMDKQNHLLLTYPSSLIAAIASISFLRAFTCHTAKSSSLSSSELFYLRRDGQNHGCILCWSVVTRNIQRLNVKAMKWYYIQLIMMYIYI